MSLRDRIHKVKSLISLLNEMDYDIREILEEEMPVEVREGLENSLATNEKAKRHLYGIIKTLLKGG